MRPHKNGYKGKLDRWEVPKGTTKTILFHFFDKGSESTFLYQIKNEGEDVGGMEFLLDGWDNNRCSQFTYNEFLTFLNEPNMGKFYKNFFKGSEDANSLVSEEDKPTTICRFYPWRKNKNETRKTTR